MNKTDKKKFVELFVDFTKDGVKAIPTDEEVEVIMKKVIPQHSNGFVDYLRYQATYEHEDPDEWDRWYEALTYEDIDETEIKKYGLPSKKIKYDCDWTKQMVIELYEVAKEFVEEAQKLPLYNSNIVVGYKFDKAGMHMFFYAPRNVDLPKELQKSFYNHSVRTAVDTLFKQYACGKEGKSDTFSSKADAILNKYKEIANSNKVYIKRSIASLNDDDRYYTGRWWTIDSGCVSANISGEDSETFNNNFAFDLFETINDQFITKSLPSK